MPLGLDDVCTITGTALAVIGLLAASPEATRHRWRRITTAPTRATTWTRRKIAELIPWLAPRPQVIAATANLGALGTTLSVAVTGHQWIDTWSTDEKINKLHQLTQDIERRLNDNVQKLRTEVSERQHDVEDLKLAIAHETESIRASIRQTEQEAAAFNADLLPAVALGTIIAGLAQYIAEIPYYLWCDIPCRRHRRRSFRLSRAFP